MQDDDEQFRLLDDDPLETTTAPTKKHFCKKLCLASSGWVCMSLVVLFLLLAAGFLLLRGALWPVCVETPHSTCEHPEEGKFAKVGEKIHKPAGAYRLLTFNTWRLGRDVRNGVEKVAKHISIVDPDVVALQVRLGAYNLVRVKGSAVRTRSWSWRWSWRKLFSANKA